MFTLLCAISIQILKFFCKDRRLLLYMSRTLHLFGTDWCAMMVPIQVIRWYRMQCYDGTDSCAIVVPIRRYCQLKQDVFESLKSINKCINFFFCISCGHSNSLHFLSFLHHRIRRYSNKNTILVEHLICSFN